MRVLAIDQGTSATKALVVDDSGEVLAVAERPVRSMALADGGVEQDPSELLRSVVEAGREAIDAGGVAVDAVGLANQGETVLAWDRSTGEPTSSAISWQDRRSIAVTERLSEHASRLAELTGLPLDPYFSAPKLAWLNERGHRDDTLSTTDSWLVHQLTGAFVTDVTTASRSLLLDLDERRWSDEAADCFGLDPSGFPEIVSCAEIVGETSAFGRSLPLAGLCVDQQAALIGERCLERGEAKCTFGTGAFLLITTGDEAVRSRHGLSASVAWELPNSVGYCLDGQSYTAGAAISWLIRMGLLDAAADLDAVASSAGPLGSLTVVPALAGLGAPFWEPAAAGSIEGLDMATTPSMVVSATIEGLAAQVALLAAAASDDLGSPLTALRVDGGLTRSRVLLQVQADLLQLPLEVFASPDATALGIASLAMLGAVGKPLPAKPLPPALRVEPRISAGEAAERLDRFSAAAARVVQATGR